MTNEDVVYARLLCFSTLPCNYLILCSMQSMALLSSLSFFWRNSAFFCSSEDPAFQLPTVVCCIDHLRFTENRTKAGIDC